VFIDNKFPIPLRRVLAISPGLLLILVLLAACGGSGPTVSVPTPTPVSLSFTTLDLGLPPQALNAPVVGTVPDSTILHVGITFKINEDQLNHLAQNGQGKTNATSTPTNGIESLGIDDATYQKIKAFFGIENATLKLSKSRTNLDVDAKASSFARLLQTRFVLHKLNGRTFYTPDPAKPPQVPTFIAGSILAVTGLDNYSLPPEHRTVFGGQALQQTQTVQNANCTTSTAVVLPQEVAQAYGFTQFWKQNSHGENMKVNLVEIDGFTNSDVNNYFSCVNFKGRLDTVTVGGKAPDPGGETTLDIEMLAGLAPAIHIIDYQTDTSQSQSFGDVWGLVNDSLQQIINDNANTPDSAGIVSMSLGLSEEFMTHNDISAIDQSLQVLTKALHMTVFVASGDCGAFTDHIYSSLSVSFPASDTYAVAVGGTVLNVNNNGDRAKEVAWSDGSNILVCQNQWGTGGGVSKLFTRPEWQTGAGVQNSYSNSRRQLPDVSAIADNLPIYYQGEWIAVGGTSAAAPIWAAGMALVNQTLIQQQGAYFYGPDTFYSAASSAGQLHPFYDVTQGDNLYYHAAQGWDYTTGLGTPNLVDLYSVLKQSLH